MASSFGCSPQYASCLSPLGFLSEQLRPFHRKLPNAWWWCDLYRYGCILQQTTANSLPQWIMPPHTWRSPNPQFDGLVTLLLRVRAVIPGCLLANSPSAVFLDESYCAHYEWPSVFCTRKCGLYFPFSCSSAVSFSITSHFMLDLGL